MSGTCFGWGYEGHTIDDLLDECARKHIHTVADVRLNAISRKKGFSKTALSQALINAGIEYVHLRALGNEKANRPGFAYPHTPQWDLARSRFAQASLETSAGQSALVELAGLLEGGNVLVLCFEADHECCHRDVVLRRLKEYVPAGL